MKVNIITIFPEVIKEILSMGMLGVAQKKQLVECNIVSPREFAKDVHRTVDDVPYGGGAGMVLMAPPIVQAVESLSLTEGSPVILTSPAGKRFDRDLAHHYAAQPELTFICGRYKGIDERVKQLVVTEEVSIGDYILSGGELAAAVCIEAVVRLLDQVLGNEESRNTDSFETKRGRMLDCSYYTRPAEYRGIKVPDVLVSGNHKEIEKWRERSSLDNTRAMRPDLLKEKEKMDEEETK
jgi:tRNA (guanine37-N1)-methyltransferase